MAEVFEQSAEQLNAHNAAVVEQFRANGGVVQLPQSPPGVKLLLLTVVGAKTGKQRVVPLGYFVIDDAVVVCAAFGGAPRNPDWVANLRAEPRVRVEIGDEAFDAEALEVPPRRHQHLWTEMLSTVGDFGDPRTKTTRVIPLFELKRLPGT